MYKIILPLLICGCTVTHKPEPIPEETSRMVYHIQPDAALDDEAFTLCNPGNAYPYYSLDLAPTRDKSELIRYFKNGYHAPLDVKESGFVTIRFMVNCYGMPGRYRIIEFNDDYREIKFSAAITDQLLRLTKEIKDWTPKVLGTVTYDSYCYFLFKIENGKLTDVLP